MNKEIIQLGKNLVDLKYSVLKPKIKIQINDKAFFVNSARDYRYFWKQLQNGEWEPQTFKIFDIFLDCNHSYIDIGSWIGPTVLYGCQLAKHCYAIEPDPVAFEYLKNNIKLNPNLISHISLSNKCIIDSCGMVYLSPKGQKGGDSMSSTVFEKSTKSWYVPAITLQQLIFEHSINDCNFIKIDIEGGEFNALPSMVDFLKNNKPTLYLSLHPHLIIDPRKSMEKIYDVISMYKHLYDNQLHEIGKDSILNEISFDSPSEVVVSDKHLN